MPLVSVIIVNWNGKKFLSGCLDSLAIQSFRDFEVVLLDNGSEDGSADYVRTRYPWVNLVELKANLGFAGGNNRALESCRGELIVTLNNDTQVEAEFLQELVAAAADPKIGMVAAKMLDFYNRRRIDSVGIRAARSGMGYNIGIGETDLGQFDQAREVFGPCAGAALYRRALLEGVGCFDGDFFAYYEDLDLAWRGRLAGWKCLTAPKAVVYHVHSATSGKGSPFAVYQIQRNKWYTLLKAWPFTLLLREAPRIFIYDLASLVLALLQGRGGVALQARLDVLRNLKALLKKRKAIQNQRLTGLRELRAWLAEGESAYRTYVRKKSVTPTAH